MQLEIAEATVAALKTRRFAPVAVSVLHGRGSLKSYAAENGTHLPQAAIASGKAHGALAMGLSSRTLPKMGENRPSLIAALALAAGGARNPVAAGVLIGNWAGALSGAAGVCGDTCTKDEMASIAAVRAAGLSANPRI
jgi:uncharacterized protein GlcG (DUF336 family)